MKIHTREKFHLFDQIYWVLVMLSVMVANNVSTSSKRKNDLIANCLKYLVLLIEDLLKKMLISPYPTDGT